MTIHDLNGIAIEYVPGKKYLIFIDRNSLLDPENTIKYLENEPLEYGSRALILDVPQGKTLAEIISIEKEAEDERIAAAVAAERERCAKKLDDVADDMAELHEHGEFTLRKLAEQIRSCE